MALRRRPASSGDRHPDGGTGTFEIICRMCGDDPGLDHRRAPAELCRIRGSYTLMAGIAAFLRHQEFHDGAGDAEPATRAPACPCPLPSSGPRLC
jgi:hypothetical protein